MTSDPLVQQLAETLIGLTVIPFDDERVNAQRDLFRARWPEAKPPRALVQAATVEHVQAAIRSAGQLGLAVHVVPNASGNGATFAGDSKPALVLDLSQMNAVIEFNADSGYALVEPGVSFDRLRQHIERHNAPYWVDTDVNGANSISGSVAERAFGFTPYGDHLLMQCGMEVVTANGRIMRTGMGALPGSDTWQLFKYNYGPYLDGLFSRADYGVITKLGLWLMPAPPTTHAFCVRLSDRRAVGAVIEFLRPLKIGMVVPNTVMISHASADRALLAASGKSVPEDDESWSVYAAIYGTPDNVALTWDTVAAGLRGIEGTALVGSGDAAPTAWPARKNLMHGIPAFSDTRAAGSGRLSFAAAAPMEAEAAQRMLRLLDASAAAKSFALSYEFALSWRTMFLQVDVTCADGQRKNCRAACLRLIAELTEAGYAITHDSPELQVEVREAHIGAGLKRVYRALDAALDPDAILGERDA